MAIQVETIVSSILGMNCDLRPALDVFYLITRVRKSKVVEPERSPWVANHNHKNVTCDTGMLKEICNFVKVSG